MSGTTNPPYQTDPFTDTERTDIRRFCGYGFYGLSDQFSNYRFFEPEMNLEYRMTNCTDTECTLARTYLGYLNTLEQTLVGIGSGGSADTLTADAAASYKHNQNEIADRNRLLNMFSLKLCGVFRMPPGPALDNGSAVGCYN